MAQEGTEQREPEQRETTDHEETQEDELSQTNQRLEAEPSRPSPASTVSEESLAYAIKYRRIRIRHNKPLFSGLPGSCEQEMRVELEGYVEGGDYITIF